MFSAQFPGCQQACQFHHETSSQPVQQTQPVIHTRGEEVVKILGNGARWPRPPTTNPSNPLVYVVMRKQDDESSSWRQVTQTVDLTARLPEEETDPDPTNVRVLVVDPEGLVTIYSPVSSLSTPPIPHSVEILLGNEAVRKIMGIHRKKINTEVSPTSAAKSSNKSRTAVSAPWELREVSLIHQKVLVIAEVAWTPQVSRGVYLVTWEVDGGGLKGNLFTDSTCVTLSLWPDTIYHIQVLKNTRQGIGKVDFRESEPAFAWREIGKPFRNPPVHPTEIRTSISSSSAVKLNTKLAPQFIGSGHVEGEREKELVLESTKITFRLSSVGNSNPIYCPLAFSYTCQPGQAGSLLKLTTSSSRGFPSRGVYEGERDSSLSLSVCARAPQFLKEVSPVELVSRTSEHRPSRSESLVIDTHRAPRANVPLLSSPTVPGRSHPLLSVLVSGGGGGGPRQLEAVAGTGAAVLLFLVVVAVLVWRHRRGLRGTDRVGDTDIRGRKLVDELTGSGFQPIVTVVTNPADQPDKGLGFGSFLSSKGFARGCLPASSPSSGISNPLLCPPTPSQDDVYSSSTFLQGAERAARNEVQRGVLAGSQRQAMVHVSNLRQGQSLWEHKGPSSIETVQFSYQDTFKSGILSSSTEIISPIAMVEFLHDTSRRHRVLFPLRVERNVESLDAFPEECFGEVIGTQGRLNRSPFQEALFRELIAGIHSLPFPRIESPQGGPNSGASGFLLSPLATGKQYPYQLRLRVEFTEPRFGASFSTTNESYLLITRSLVRSHARQSGHPVACALARTLGTPNSSLRPPFVTTLSFMVQKDPVYTSFFTPPLKCVCIQLQLFIMCYPYTCVRSEEPSLQLWSSVASPTPTNHDFRATLVS
uniref:Uncharacterized protein n=1 Tax=Timema bartmani TaxID=61472 RepID=A0A7R9ERX0_9NEOP|nr:unnamed protein product [Timema bartmani]